MDSKDFRLLVALHEDGRRKPQELGRRVSLSAPAVRERLRRLEELGILQGCLTFIELTTPGQVAKHLARPSCAPYVNGGWRPFFITYG